MPWQPGEQIGPYTIVTQLGQGGMATVFKAYHQRLDRHVAIKVMHQNFLDDDGFQERFKREAKIVARLDHPHIVPIYDFDDQDGRPYLVMKYVDGETLKARIRRGLLTLEEILSLLRAVGDALTYAHQQGIMHRDIKPSNIVMDSHGIPYLMDFGLARIATIGESTLSADMLLGTPHYISPEQARGEKNLDGRTDIYALGVIAYELVVGKVPFTADTPYAIIHDHIYTPLPLPSTINPEIPPEIETVLTKALAKSREDRFATADAMTSAFEKAVMQSGLIALSEERDSLAAVSLARLRAEYQAAQGEQMSTTAVKDSAAPQPISIPATEAAKPSQQYTQSGVVVASRRAPRVWIFSGCGWFLLISLISMGILLGAADNLGDLSLLIADSPERDRMADDLIAIGVDQDDRSGIPLIRIPPMPVEAVQRLVAQRETDEVAYLVLARAYLQREDEANAYETILAGAQVAENLAVYSLNAARQAEEAGYDEAAVGYYLVALSLAEDESDIFNSLRPLATEGLYRTAPRIDWLALQDVEALLFTEAAEILAVDTAFESSIAAITIAHNRLTAGAPIVAQGIAQRLIEQPGAYQPEIMLIYGEIRLNRNQPQDAMALWEGILDLDAVPDWVEDRTDELITRLEDTL